MQAAVLHRHGGPEALAVESEWPVPEPKAGEVLIRVGAAGINNTDINTRIGWYSKTVRGDTGSIAEGTGVNDSADSSWAGASIAFPRIQGADICGEIVAVGDTVDRRRIGQRVIVRTMQSRGRNEEGPSFVTTGADCDGGFAEYATTADAQALSIDSTLSDVELASFPCAYSTAENMLERIGLSKSERVLITGASGGVGSAAVQLAKRRDCHVTAITSVSKADFVRQLGADETLDRDAPLPAFAFDVCVDVVAGPAFNNLLDSLKRGGRYICAGAIAGPIVELDVRTVYLKDLTLAGSTWQSDAIMENLVGYIERGEIAPVVSKTYPLSKIHEAQADFIDKLYPGKLVLIPEDQWIETDQEAET